MMETISNYSNVIWVITVYVAWAIGRVQGREKARKEWERCSKIGNVR